MTFSNWNTSFLLERVAALAIVSNFDRKRNTRTWDFHGFIRSKVIVTQNIPTMTELFTMGEYQYGCTFCEKRYSHTGIFQ